jgi:ABC-type branched-subunit amino acid transport system substrate-binding protein
LVLLALAAVPSATAGGGATPGVTPTTVTIGGSVPITGPAAAFGSVARGADAYFKYVNARGGVNGRKIVYKYLDDAYDPSQTVLATRQLVQQEQVLAIFNTVGTENNLAVRSFLNQAKVPQLFVGTGVSKIGREHAKYPWTIGYLPSFTAEGRIYGRYLVKSKPKAKVAVLYENSDYGADLTAGLRKALGGKAARIVATQAYEPTDATIESQMARLKSSGANTFMMFATPKFAILAFIAVNKLGWHPQIFVSSVSISPNIMDIARVSTQGRSTEGALSIAFVKDPTDTPRYGKDPAMKLYSSILKRYLPSGKYEDVYNYYGMAVAYTMVDALKKAGRNLTRESLLRASTHLQERNPFMLAGIKIRTGPSDYFPIDQARFVRYHKAHWVPFGPLAPAQD